MTPRRRRALLRVLFASGASAAAAAVIVPVVAASGASGAPSHDGAPHGRAPGPVHDVRFDEMYRGGHTDGDRHGPGL